jgi:V/A-type H+-transporting ATPase subunit F
LVALEQKLAVVGDRANVPLFRSIGAVTVEASNEEEALRAVESLSSRPDVGLVVVLRHVISDEEEFRRKAEKFGVPLLVLPTRWSRVEPINVDKLIARALGMG